LASKKEGRVDLLAVVGVVGSVELSTGQLVCGDLSVAEGCQPAGPVGLVEPSRPVWAVLALTGRAQRAM